MVVVPLTLPTVLPNLLRANWAGTVSIENGFQVDVTASRETGAEERRGLTDRQARQVNVVLTGMTLEESHELWMNLARMTGQRTVLPLYPDQGILTASSTGRFINVDTTKKRLFVGARVVVFDTDYAGHPNQIEYRTIVALSSTQIDLGTNAPDQLQNSYAAGSFVFPLLDIEVSLESSKGVHHTAGYYGVSFEATEVVGASALEALVDGLPSGFPTYLGYPILTIRPNWDATLNSSARAVGDGYQLGTGFVAEPTGERPIFEHDLQLTLMNRTESWAGLTFIESRAGRLRPWWLLNPATLLRATATTTTYVDVEAYGNIEDAQDFLQYVVIEKHIGDPIIRGVDTIAVQGGGWRITFDTTITAPSLGEIRRTTSAHLVRNSSDAHTEVWTTNTVVQVALKCEDLIDEADYPISGIVPTPPSLGPLAAIPDLYFWASVSGPVWVDLDGGGLTPTDPTGAYPQVGQGFSDADFVYDARRHPSVITLVEPYLQRLGAGSTAPITAYFKDARYNNGQRTFYHFGIDDLEGWTLENSQAPFWDATDGLTVFIVARFGGPAINGSFVEHYHLFREGIFEWFGNGTVGAVRMFATADAVVGAANFTYTEPTDSELRILAFRWDPGVVAELFISGHGGGDGAAVASAATPAASIATTLRDTRMMQYLGPNFIGPVGGGDGNPQQIDFNLDRVCMSNEGYLVKRALTNTEMNTVGSLFALKYNLPWANIT